MNKRKIFTIIVLISISIVGCNKAEKINETDSSEINSEAVLNQQTEKNEELLKKEQLYIETEEVYLVISKESLDALGTMGKTEYQYNEYGEVIEEKYYPIDNPQQCTYVWYEYDLDGNKICTKGGTVDYITNQRDYEYQDNKLIKEKWSYYYDNNWQTSEWIYEYKEKYMKVKYGSGMQEIYYNENEKIVKQQDYDIDGKLLRTVDYFYDDKGNSSKEIYTYDDYQSIWIIDNQYDEFGKLIAIYYTKEGEENKSHISYGYDELGNQTYIEKWSDGTYYWDYLQYKLFTVKKR